MRETPVRRRHSRHESPPRRGRTRPAVAALGPLVALVALVALVSLVAAGVAVAEPAATFSISEERPFRAQEVTFTADDACAGPATCAWSVGGDHFANGRVASLSFETVGLRAITLTIDDGADETGPASSVTQLIEVVNRAPVVSFASTASGLAVAFDATVVDADGDPLRYAWDFGDGAASSEADPSHVYAAAGSYVVKLTVADSHDSTTVSETVTVAAPNRAPTAAFASTVDGLAVALDAGASSDPDGDALTYSWNFGDGETGEGATVRHVFSTSDSYEVSLRVDDGRGGVDAETRVVPVNRPPAATVTADAERSLVGQQVTFTANSGDPDGDGLRLEWDVDGDLDFAEGTGATLTHAFAFAGRQVVRLRATDDHGATTVAAAAVEVGDTAPVPESGRPTDGSPRPRPKLIQPFPTVRIAGRLAPTGAVFRLVTVRAPRGTRIRWNCSARRCRPGHRSGGGLVRLRALQRPFRAGTVIEIRVTRRGRIGKYTRVEVRRTGAPARRDLCLPPTGGKPRSCSG